MGKKITNQVDGFTLIEVLLYVAIFASIIGAIILLATAVSFQKVQSQVIAEVNFQGEAVMSQIIQSIHNSTSITSPTLGSSAASLSLAMQSPVSNPTLFSAVSDGTANRVQISEGPTPTLNYLTNSHITVSGLSFNNVGIAGSKGSILIQFTLSYRTNSQSTAFNYSKTFYGAAGAQ